MLTIGTDISYSLLVEITDTFPTWELNNECPTNNFDPLFVESNTIQNRYSSFNKIVSLQSLI